MKLAKIIQLKHLNFINHEHGVRPCFMPNLSSSVTHVDWHRLVIVRGDAALLHGLYGGGCVWWRPKGPPRFRGVQALQFRHHHGLLGDVHLCIQCCFLFRLVHAWPYSLSIHKDYFVFTLLSSIFSSCSHSWEAGGAVLFAFSVFFRLSGLWFGHRAGHSLHQPVRGAASLRHLRRSLLFSLYAALLSALWILPEPAGENTNQINHVYVNALIMEVYGARYQ